MSKPTGKLAFAYKSIAKLEAENKELREALESMMRDTGLVPLMRPDQVERNRRLLGLEAVAVRQHNH